LLNYARAYPSSHFKDTMSAISENLAALSSQQNKGKFRQSCFSLCETDLITWLKHNRFHCGTLRTNIYHVIKGTPCMKFHDISCSGSPFLWTDA